MEERAQRSPSHGTQLPDAVKDGQTKESKDSKDKTRRGLTIPRYFTTPGRHPFDAVDWERRSASLASDKGEVIFEQNDIEVPRAWSQMALKVVASKYFYGAPGSAQREGSVKVLLTRVATTITRWGTELGYFASPEDATSFEMELLHLLVHQKASFNSPVWFNMGVEERPQCSACFINSVEDTMDSILELAKIEGKLFKYGSGTGTNLSPLRSSKEKLSAGGTASGPVSFMRGYDAFAGVIKSGGKTRRAAKMVILNVDHPDILEFIRVKPAEERKAWTLIDAGYDGSINGEAYSSVFFQNSNNSVRVTDEFMKAVEGDGLWQTRAVTTGEPVDTCRARDLMREISEAAWQCGDPGLQFHTTINDWHTCPNTAPIHASNPCSEFMFLDDSACNLASLNLMKFVDLQGEFDIDAFRAAVAVMILAQEIIVDQASYPTERIARNSFDYRPLGLGYANLGSVLMNRGLPYDSDSGRALAATITAVMTGQAYATSADISQVLGPFKGFARNREPMGRVMRKHRDALSTINPDLVPQPLLEGAWRVWDEAVEKGDRWGYRNAQVTVLAPTGTIAFMMDCDTTGIEPDLALVKHKVLVGGGTLQIVNQTLPMALRRLGYDAQQVAEIMDFISEHETIEGAPHLRDEHVAVFDCAFRPVNGRRFIHHMGHVRMMGAVQPFISGAISKTVNLPNESKPEDIAEIYTEAWRHGLKSIAIYRDGSKRVQPLSSGRPKKKPKKEEQIRPVRRRLPEERQSITHKFVIGDHEGYVTVGLYPDGKPGEIFIVMAKEGTVVSGLCDCFATAISMALQYGVPLKVLVNKFVHTRFEPSGFTHHPEIHYAKSIADYIFRWLDLKFGTRAEENGDENGDQDAHPPRSGGANGTTQLSFLNDVDAPTCSECGSFMTRNGSCYRCQNCGATSGCS
jgi:ribonucleoside-diphosphate reductase alpha chain